MSETKLNDQVQQIRISLTNAEVENRTLKSLINQYESQISKIKKENDALTAEDARLRTENKSMIQELQDKSILIVTLSEDAKEMSEKLASVEG